MAISEFCFHTCGTRTQSEIRGRALRRHAEPLMNAGRRHRNGRKEVAWNDTKKELCLPAKKVPSVRAILHQKQRERGFIGRVEYSEESCLFSGYSS